jgi:hypothetical protein
MFEGGTKLKKLLKVLIPITIMATILFMLPMGSAMAFGGGGGGGGGGYDLTMAVIPPGSGTTSPSVGTHYNVSGTVDISATAGEGYVFDHWEASRHIFNDGQDESTDNPESFHINHDVTVTAHFHAIPHYDLTVNVMPPDSGCSVTLDPPGGSYTPGTVVTLTPAPSDGYIFLHWDGEAGSTDNPLLLTMPAHDVTIAACFMGGGAVTATVDPGVVHIHVNGDNSVTVSGTIDCTAIATVSGTGNTNAHSGASYFIDGVQTIIPPSPIDVAGGDDSTSDASHTYTWSATITEVGPHGASQGGRADAFYHKAGDGNGEAHDEEGAEPVFFTVAPPPIGACGGSVQCSEIVLSPPPPLPENTYYVSDTVTASGTVDIVCVATAHGNPSVEAHASSDAFYTVTGPDSTVIDSGNSPVSSDDYGSEEDPTATADASQTYDWSSTFTLNQEGQYTVEQGGSYEASTSDSEGQIDSMAGAGSNSVTITAVTAPPPVVHTVVISPEQPWWYPCHQLFTLGVGGYVQYRWIDGPDGNKLPAIEQTGMTAWMGVFTEMKVVIAEGTQVTGAHYLNVNYYDGHVILRTIGGPIAFSVAPQFYIFQDGTWVEVTP